METNVSTKVVTGKVRFSYAHVFEPVAMAEGQEAKYQVSLIIPKSDLKTLGAIEKAIEAAKVVGKDKISKNGKLIPGLKLPLRDGDEERPDNPEYADAMFVNCSSKIKPGIVDRDLNPIMSQEEFYSGCYGRASINFYAFNNAGNRGIACGLNNLQKLADGEPLAGGSTAEADFGGDNAYVDEDPLA